MNNFTLIEKQNYWIGDIIETVCMADLSHADIQIERNNRHDNYLLIDNIYWELDDISLNIAI